MAEGPALDNGAATADGPNSPPPAIEQVVSEEGNPLAEPQAAAAPVNVALMLLTFSSHFTFIPELPVRTLLLRSDGPHDVICLLLAIYVERTNANAFLMCNLDVT